MQHVFSSGFHWLLIAGVLLLASIGLGGVAAELSNAFRDWLRGEPPKPRPYRVTIEDYEGWPLRSYKLPAEAIGRLLRDIERDKPA